MSRLQQTMRETIAHDLRTATQRQQTWDAATCTERIFATIERLGLERDDIRVLVEATIAAALELAHAAGARVGRVAVLDEHPALAAFGAAVRAAVDTDRTARVRIARDVLDRSARLGSNAWAAAHEALDALAPREGQA